MGKQREARTILEYNNIDIRLVKYSIQVIRALALELSLQNKIKEVLKKDGHFSRAKKKGDTVKDQLLLHCGLIYVPELLRNRVIQEYYDKQAMGHFGIKKIIEQIT